MDSDFTKEAVEIIEAKVEKKLKCRFADLLLKVENAENLVLKLRKMVDNFNVAREREEIVRDFITIGMYGIED